MDIFILLLVIALVLCVAEAMGKAPSWAVEFVLIVALLVKFWGGR